MTDPLVPADTDLRDFQYMPLDVVRLVDSDLAALATGDEFRCAVILWCKAWHQVPASSLPNDDRLLSHLAGFGRDMKAWRAVRDMALRGFVECSDGRLYHPVIAQKAIEAADAKRRRRERTAKATAAREAKSGGRDVERNEPPDEERDVDRDVERNVHQGIGKGEGREGIEEDPPNPQAAADIDFAVSTWNDTAKGCGLPRAQNITDKRRKAILLRLKDVGGFDGWCALLEKIRGSPFLRGQNREGWRCDLDWVLKPANLTKIMEGNYDDRKSANGIQGAIDDLRRGI